MSKITVIYDPEHGAAIRDDHARWEVDYAVRRFLDTRIAQSLNTANALPVMLIRLAVKNGKLMPSDIKLVHRTWGDSPDPFDKELWVDIRGNLNEHPEGFCDHMDMAVSELIDWNKPRELQPWERDIVCNLINKGFYSDALTVIQYVLNCDADTAQDVLRAVNLDDAWISMEMGEAMGYVNTINTLHAAQHYAHKRTEELREDLMRYHTGEAF